MKRNIWTLIVALLLLSSLDASAQRWKLQRYQVDLYLAGVSFHGDIGLPDQPLANTFNGFRPSVGITPRFFLTQSLTVGLDLGYVIYGGKDPAESSHGRVYTFNSHGFQHFARLEYYILSGTRSRGGSAIYNRRGMINNYNKLNLYVFGGGGGILSKSKIKDQEGNEPTSNPGYYNNLQYTAGFPVGGGIKFSIDPRWSVGAEIGYQFTLSDKLDGYAPEASSYNDSYYLTSIRLVYRLSNDRKGVPVFRKYYK